MSKLLSSLILIICFSISQISAKSDAQEYHSSEIQTFFEDILLIINFNHPYYGNIEFLKEIYSPYFPNIVFYGEAAHPEVVKIKTGIGWHVHRVLKDALIRYPGFRGYICTQDDCFIGFWNFQELNKDKIWFHQNWTVSLDTVEHPWPWWKKSCGRNAVWQAYHKLDACSTKQLKENLGYRNIPYSWADFFYLPNSYRSKFLKICDCFDNPDVFLEISIPTILFCLEQKNKMEMLHVFWGGTGVNANFDYYHPNFHWIHPIKFSCQSSREFVLNVIESQINN